jgi:hypothetical protein
MADSMYKNVAGGVGKMLQAENSNSSCKQVAKHVLVPPSKMSTYPGAPKANMDKGG